jgi:hypothetical protein
MIGASVGRDAPKDNHHCFTAASVPTGHTVLGEINNPPSSVAAYHNHSDRWQVAWSPERCRLAASLGTVRRRKPFSDERAPNDGCAVALASAGWAEQ